MMRLLALLFVFLAAPAAATPYALVDPAGANVLEVREWEAPPPDLGASGTANPYWLILEIVDPPFDPATQVRTGPVRAILADRVTDTWTVRAKTAQELADEVAADQQSQIDQIGEVGFKALYLMDSRARKLRGDPAITPETFTGQLKALRNNPIPNPDPRTPMTLLRFDASVTIGAIAGAAFTDKTFAVPGLQVTDLILSATFTAGLLPNTIGYQVLRVSATDTLAMRFHKIATGSVTPAAPQALSLIVWRP